MKHQYFGDINDYLKYGILRRLEKESGLRLGVCWMLTPNDVRTDGKFTSYLESPRNWRPYDDALFDVLSELVPLERHVRHVRERRVLQNALFFEDMIGDARTARAAYFVRAQQSLTEAELIFFDPDNGIQVPSCPVGRAGSSKYVMWDEIVSTYESGQSVLIYQHFPRESRDQFVYRIGRDLKAKTSSPYVVCFRTAKVGFFLAATEAHRERLARATAALESRWAREILVTKVNCNSDRPQ
jgi:hypothetical protein